MRIYLPSTLAQLAALLPSGALADPAATLLGPNAVAYAVTPALREWYREGDLEELEYVALNHAARASLLLLAGEAGAGPARRVVLAADVPDAATAPAPSDSAASDIAAVRLREAVTVSMLAAVHVDDPAICDEVAAAAVGWAAVVGSAGAGDGGGDGGDDDARFAVDSLDDHELQWYAVQELPFLFS
ncbi:MAG: DUF6912 family protein [Acidothermaceae bacterium]